MHLVLDIGNSALKIARASGDTVTLIERVDAPTWPTRLAALQRALDDRVTAAAIVSVVPAHTAALVEELKSRALQEVHVVGPEGPLPFQLSYATPDTLGADRLAAAAGAVAFFGDTARTVLVVDAGTAVTYEVVSEGVYRGGAIALGPRLLQRGLHAGTAQLPNVQLDTSATPIGDSTVSAIQAGMYHQFIDSVDGMLRRLQAATPPPHVVIATGGWADTLLTALPDSIDHVADDLVLQGGHTLLQLALAGA